MNTADLEIVTMGRVGVDLYPEDVGVSLVEASRFTKSLGGSPVNVAVAAARLGRRAAVITKVGDDPFGVFVRDALGRFRVDARWVGVDASLRTPIVFCEMHPPDRFPLFFYREPSAPDLQIRKDEIDFGAISSVPLLWSTGTGLCQEPSREATLAALASRPRALATIHDFDYRPSFWPDPAEATALAREAVSNSTVAVGNLDEVFMAVGERSAGDAAAALLELGVDLAVVKMGPRGVLGRTRDEQVTIPAVAVEVVNGLGAGDGFGGALCHALLAGWDLERTLRYANAAGAIVASRRTCADEMPTNEEIESLMMGAGADA